MLNKFLLYLGACNKGEILKRIEYKFKDIFGYFYIRNIISRKKVVVKLNIPNIRLKKNTTEKEENIYIFGEPIRYEELLNYFVCDEKFWRRESINNYEDIKIVWEANRLQFLLPYAIKYSSSRKKTYRDVIVETLDFWIQNNKFEYSINWNSNLEVAIRAINISLVLSLLGEEELSSKYSHLLYLHGEHIYNEIYYSKCCIPNNHVLGEAVALLLLSHIVESPKQKKWKKRALDIIKKFNDIIADDGMSNENSFSYHFFVVKMFVVAMCFIKDEELLSTLNTKVLNSLKILKLAVFDDGKVINYGDNDGGFLFSSDSDYSLGKDILRYHNYFFRNIVDSEIDMIKQLDNFFSKSSSFIHEEGLDENKFNNDNIFLYNWDNNLIFFNAKSISGHAHNDSLAVCLVVDNKEIFLDSGTYSYNINKSKRAYYRSREAHSTIQTEDGKVAIQIASFRWKNISESYIYKVEEDENMIFIAGKITGLCERKIYILKKEKKIVIEDDVACDRICNNWITKNLKKLNNHLTGNGVNVYFKNLNSIEEKKVYFSEKYLQEQEGNVFKIVGDSNSLTTIIEW